MSVNLQQHNCLPDMKHSLEPLWALTQSHTIGSEDIAVEGRSQLITATLQCTLSGALEEASTGRSTYYSNIGDLEVGHAVVVERFQIFGNSASFPQPSCGVLQFTRTRR
jgi:hypothetical protein